MIVIILFIERCSVCSSINIITTKPKSCYMVNFCFKIKYLFYHREKEMKRWKELDVTWPCACWSQGPYISAISCRQQIAVNPILADPIHLQRENPSISFFLIKNYLLMAPTFFMKFILVFRNTKTQLIHCSKFLWGK